MPTSHREASRQRLRESLLVAARELTIARGWHAVRMADVAVAAGVSRQTVYNEFTAKDGLADAMASREITEFVTGVRSRLAEHGDDVRAAARAAVLHSLTEAAGNPLVKAILTSARGGADELLPYLTTRAELVLAAATGAILEWAGEHLPGHDPGVVQRAAETLVRLTVSYVVLPVHPAEETAEHLAELLTLLLRCGCPEGGESGCPEGGET